MIKSMTAYGRGEYQLDDSIFIAEIKSVNNRYRDIILRIPKNFQPLEEELKSLISSRVRRGRIEVNIQMESNGSESGYELELNEPLVDSYSKIFKQLAEQFGGDQFVSIDTLCQMRDVIVVKPETLDIEKIGPGFREALRVALESFDQMRIKEGEAIKADLQKRLELMEGYIEEVTDRVPSVLDEYRKRLRERIALILEDVEVDEDRLAQEVAFFAEKSDISEEIVRTKSHLSQFKDFFSLDDALGRRLDFLIQEINREVNTLSSKASDSSISKLAVEMKAEMEKLREQVQNVE